jgi:hypothetical protein
MTSLSFEPRSGNLRNWLRLVASIPSPVCKAVILPSYGISLVLSKCIDVLNAHSSQKRIALNARLPARLTAMSTPLEHFSHRSKMIICLTRKDAGSRGAAAIEVADLLQAITNEDQGELAKRFVGSVTQSGPLQAPSAFFSAEAASKVLLRLRSILPQRDPVADSADMTMSPGLERILNAAATLAGELHHNQVQPLHLVAAILAEENSGPAEILKEAGISREGVIQALQSQ